MLRKVSGLLCASMAIALLVFPSAGSAQLAPARNVVLVHGAFVTGAGWKPVYDLLVRDGYNVTIAQHPLTSFADDLAAVKRTLAATDGPIVLVGHSYGGALITAAGNDPKVVSLVYIAAHALDEGETEAGNGKKFPNEAAPLKKSADGFVSIDPDLYRIDFAADLPAEQAAFEAHAQAPTSAKVFTVPAKKPAWKTKPSWFMVAKGDRIINPDLERMYAKRAGSTTVEIDFASHSVYQSHPTEVAAMIADASRAVVPEEPKAP
ncbi:MAG: alpha/beta fold hydrolase [Rhodanobacteraceae bacterium]